MTIIPRVENRISMGNSYKFMCKSSLLDTNITNVTIDPIKIMILNKDENSSMT